MRVYISLRHEAEGNITSRVIEGILSDDKVIYNDEGFTITLKFSDENTVLIKKNSDYKITIDFKEGLDTKALYETLGHKLELNVQTINLKRDHNSIHIHYIVEGINEIKYNIKYEVKE